MEILVNAIFYSIGRGQACRISTLLGAAASKFFSRWHSKMADRFCMKFVMFQIEIWGQSKSNSQTASKVEVSKTAARTRHVIFYTVPQNINTLVPSLHQLLRTAVKNCVSCCHSCNCILCSACVLVFFHWAKEVKISQGNVQAVGWAVSEFTSEFLNCLVCCVSCMNSCIIVQEQ